MHPVSRLHPAEPLCILLEGRKKFAYQTCGVVAHFDAETSTYTAIKYKQLCKLCCINFFLFFLSGFPLRLFSRLRAIHNMIERQLQFEAFFISDYWFCITFPYIRLDRVSWNPEIIPGVCVFEKHSNLFRSRAHRDDGRPTDGAPGPCQLVCISNVILASCFLQ